MCHGRKPWLNQRNYVISRLRIPALITAIALVAIACAEPEAPPTAFSGDLTAGNPGTAVTQPPEISGAAPKAAELSDEQTARLNGALEESPRGCEPLDTSSCMLPFPSDNLTVEDPASPTLRRVNLPDGQLPNTDGVTLDPTVWNRNDGFSPSTPILVHVPGLSEAKTKLPPQADIGFSLTPASATQLVDLDSGQLVPHWAEMDRRAKDPTRRALIIHPAVSLTETHRIGVALHDLHNASGAVIPAPIQFQVLRDNFKTDAPQIQQRRADFEKVFGEMAAAGVSRSDLYLAWWFTVASAQGLAGNVLSMRADAFGSLDGGAPAFKITDTKAGEQKGIAKIVEGTFDVPLYLTSDQPGATMVFDDAGKPQRNGTIKARFVCTIPDRAVATGEARPVVYGHGLLGDAGEAASGHVQATAAANNMVYCGTDALGLSEEDIGYVAGVLTDISKFPGVADRLQQAILDYLFLGRLMLHLDGLGSAPEFQTEGGANMLNTNQAYWDGNSQGAILGGAVTAVAQDWTKAVLGVGGMGYATLLNRSVDFDQYFAVLRGAYPDPLDQQVIFGVLQMLWDRGETSGYVQHLTSRPYDLTPPHQVIMDVAFGDHQVANVTADIIARTLKIPLYQPPLPRDVKVSKQRFWNLDPIRKFPLDGSALFYWYSGTLPPPEGNITPIMGARYAEECPGVDSENHSGSAVPVPCRDPHEDPRRQPKVQQQKNAFFRPTGKVINVCSDKPCLAKPRAQFDY